MIASADGLLGREEGNPALRFQGLAGFVDDDDIELLIPDLEASSAMQCCQDDLAAAHEIAQALRLAVSVLFPKLSELRVDGPPLPAAFRLLDAFLFSIHLVSDIGDDGTRLGRPGKDVQRVVQDGGEKSRLMAEADHGDFVGVESLDDVVHGDVGRPADQYAKMPLEHL